MGFVGILTPAHETVRLCQLFFRRHLTAETDAGPGPLQQTPDCRPLMAREAGAEIVATPFQRVVSPGDKPVDGLFGRGLPPCHGVDIEGVLKQCCRDKSIESHPVCAAVQSGIGNRAVGPVPCQTPAGIKRNAKRRDGD